MKEKAGCHSSRFVREKQKIAKDINDAYKDACLAIEKTPNALLPGLLIFVARLCEDRNIFRKGGLNRFMTNAIDL
jgi:hypothetical protein